MRIDIYESNGNKRATVVIDDSGIMDLVGRIIRECRSIRYE